MKGMKEMKTSAPDPSPAGSLHYSRKPRVNHAGLNGAYGPFMPFMLRFTLNASPPLFLVEKRRAVPNVPS